MDENEIYRAHVELVRAKIESSSESKRCDLLRLFLGRLGATVADSPILFPEFVQTPVREWAQSIADALSSRESPVRGLNTDQCEQLLADYAQTGGEEYLSALEHILGMLSVFPDDPASKMAETCLALFRFAVDLAESTEELEQSETYIDLLVREIKTQEEMLKANPGEFLRLLDAPPRIGR